MSGNRKKTGRKHSKHDHQELCHAEEKQAIIPMPHSDKHPDPQRDIIVEIDDQPKIWSKREWKYVQHVIKCCESEDGFDIYQLMAFDSDTKHAGLQEKDWCNPLEIDENGGFVFYTLILKILAFLFSSFLAYYSIDALDNIDKGMYYHLNYAENLKWLNPIWLRLGFSINLFVAVLAVYGSFLVIYFSSNALDMVLNSVALFFIVELDDLLVRNRDYERVNDYIKKLQEDGKKIGAKKIGCCKRLCMKCCTKFVSCVGFIYTLPFQILKKITILLCIFLPFFVAYCW